jgi:hypothetical protein
MRSILAGGGLATVRRQRFNNRPDGTARAARTRRRHAQLNEIRIAAAAASGGNGIFLNGAMSIRRPNRQTR